MLGRVSTATIAGGIADINAFRYDPEVSTRQHVVTNNTFVWGSAVKFTPFPGACHVA